jgi:hypothetical protein
LFEAVADGGGVQGLRAHRGMCIQCVHDGVGKLGIEVRRGGGVAGWRLF